MASRTGTEWLQNLRLHLYCWTYLLVGLSPYSPLRPSWPSCSGSHSPQGHTGHILTGISEFTVSFVPCVLHMCIFIVCNIRNEVQTVVTDELSVCSQQNTLGYILCNVTVGWCWRAPWDIRSQTWQLLNHSGYGAASCRTTPGFCFITR